MRQIWNWDFFLLWRKAAVGLCASLWFPLLIHPVEQEIHQLNLHRGKTSSTVFRLTQPVTSSRIKRRLMESTNLRSKILLTFEAETEQRRLVWQAKARISRKACWHWDTSPNVLSRPSENGSPRGASAGSRHQGTTHQNLYVKASEVQQTPVIWPMLPRRLESFPFQRTDICI